MQAGLVSNLELVAVSCVDAYTIFFFAVPSIMSSSTYLKSVQDRAAVSGFRPGWEIKRLSCSNGAVKVSLIVSYTGSTYNDLKRCTVGVYD